MLDEVVLVQIVQIEGMGMRIRVGSDSTGSEESGNVRMKMDSVGIRQSFDDDFFGDAFSIVRDDGVVGQSVEGWAGRAYCEPLVSSA